MLKIWSRQLLNNNPVTPPGPIGPSVYDVSGFSNSNYLSMPFVFNNADSWEMIMCYTAIDFGTQGMPRTLIMTQNADFGIRIDAGVGGYPNKEDMLAYIFGRNGNTFLSITDYGIEPNVDFNVKHYIKLSYTNPKYEIYHSSDGIQWTRSIYKTSSSKTYTSSNMLIGAPSYSGYDQLAFNGTLHMAEWKIVADGVTYLDIPNGINPLTIVGNPTIVES